MRGEVMSLYSQVRGEPEMRCWWGGPRRASIIQLLLPASSLFSAGANHARTTSTAFACPPQHWPTQNPLLRAGEIASEFSCSMGGGSTEAPGSPVGHRDVLNRSTAKVHWTSVALIPPSHAWGPIQAVRFERFPAAALRVPGSQ
jgi:hypothetical protein